MGYKLKYKANQELIEDELMSKMTELGLEIVIPNDDEDEEENNSEYKDNTNSEEK